MNIAVIGCGWLGFPLAIELLKHGHTVYGSTTSENKFEELNSAAILPFLYDGLINKLISIPTNEIDCLIINFPPSKSNDYPNQIAELIQQFPANCKIIFTSSTSVYQDLEGEMNENGAVKIDHAVFLAEEILRSSKRHVTILRLAGLIGSHRHPIKFLSGKAIEHGNMAVNLVHQDDVIAAIICVIQNNAWNKTYNVCWNEHPKKGNYYQNAAEKYGLTPPIVAFSNSIGKSIDGNFITIDLGYKYKNSI
jgi:nucleoside-diphosphate-sugar epimerase